MTAEKLFTVAGTATDRGITKARFANDMVARIKILNKAGCTNINLVELPRAMTKLEALQHLESLGTFEGDAAEAISTKMAEKVKVAKRAEVRVAVKPPAVTEKTAAEAETA
jgi:hypothetical protein